MTYSIADSDSTHDLQHRQNEAGGHARMSATCPSPFINYNLDALEKKYA